MTPNKLSDDSLVRLGRSATLAKSKNTVSEQLFGKTPVLLLKWPVLALFGGSTQRPKRAPAARKAARQKPQSGTNGAFGEPDHPTRPQSAPNVRSRTPTWSEAAKSAWYPEGTTGCLKTGRKQAQNTPKTAQNGPKWPLLATRPPPYRPKPRFLAKNRNSATVAVSGTPQKVGTPSLSKI